MSDDSAADFTVDLKKRARRRLVGAVALTLLAVIILPIVMDSEPKPGGQEIQIRIPSQDNDSLVARVIPGHPAQSPLPKEPEAAKPEPVTETPPVPKTPEVVEKPATPSVTSGVTEAKADSAKKEELVHAEAALEGKDAEQWVVKLGAYQKTANVKQLASKLKDMGFQSYTEKIDLQQGSRTRVLAGPFKSREAADKARVRINKIGVDGQVVQKQ